MRPGSTEEIPLPLESTSVRAQIDAYIASVEVAQRYHEAWAALSGAPPDEFMRLWAALTNESQTLPQRGVGLDMPARERLVARFDGKLDNYALIFSDPLYVAAVLSSIRIAASAALITPIASPCSCALVMCASTLRPAVTP